MTITIDIFVFVLAHMLQINLKNSKRKYFACSLAILALFVSRSFHKMSFAQQKAKFIPEKAASIDFANLESGAFGYLRIKTNLDSFLVIGDNDFAGYQKVHSGDSLKLAVGRYKIIMASEITFDYQFDVVIDTNKTTHYFGWVVIK